MNIAKLSMLVATVSLLAMPAFAADDTKADASKPTAKAAAPAAKSSKKSGGSKATKTTTKKEDKSSK